ncbi:MAG TPA: serine/threonine-protein kinase [Gemmataceae bacterium]|nr:serine/threonine-protein kinase [Gemmataceae bacterium]
MQHTAEPIAPAGVLSGLVDALKRSWRQGTPPDAARAMLDHPELLRYRSLAVDLAYEEYCLREESGRTPDEESFCRALPAFRSQVREVIRGHRLLADHPELFEPADTAWPRPGTAFEGLTIVRELGRGAFARAYLALDPATGDRPVVLKLSPTPSGEARTLGPLRHPNIVGVHWARRAGGLSAMCMPFVGVATLRDVIDAAFAPAGGAHRSARTILSAIDATAVADGPLIPGTGTALLQGRESYPDAVAAVAAELADALVHLHRSGIAHGDLKPSNVLLGPGGHPYLIDFNLAGAADTNLLRCGGTLPYMAPERILLLLGATPDDNDPTKADVYSFGAVLFELLTGRMPFELADSPVVTDVAIDLSRRARAGPPRVLSVEPFVPRRLVRLIERCLAADPRQRPSADRLKHELDRCRRRQGRWRWLLTAGVGVLAAAAVAGLLGWRSPDRVGVESTPVNVAPRRTPSTAEEFFARGVEFLREGDVAPALKDFQSAHRARPDGPTTAFLAHCFARSGQHAVAADLYRQALEIHSYRTAWVHNNLAHSLVALGTKSVLNEAVAEATRALDLSPNLRAARYNRALARFRVHLDTHTNTLADPACVDDLREVMKVGPYTIDLYFTAAVILTASADGDEERYATAVGYLRESVKLGRNPKSLAAEPVLKTHLLNREDFQQLLRLPPANSTVPSVHFQLIDPLGQ